MTSVSRPRPLTPNEQALVDAILESAQLPSADLEVIQKQVPSSRWVPMLDGGMGSLQRVVEPSVSPLSPENPSRSIGEIVFHDSDGLGASATLVIDSHDVLRELDIWKFDFSPLLTLPDHF